MTKIEHIHGLLNNLEDILKVSLIWDEHFPEEDQLCSTVPFSMDRLTPEQWLQWIFLPQMRTCLAESKVPQSMNIAPYFEEAWKHEQDKLPMIEMIREIDKVFLTC